MNATEQDDRTALVLTVEDVARRLKVNHKTIHDWMKKGITVRGQTVKLAGRWVGKRRRFSEEILEMWDEQCNPGEVVELPSERRKRDAAEERLDRELRSQLRPRRRRKG